EIEEGWCGLVLPRSGNAIKHGVTVMNAPGLIDSNYRGEIMVGLINTDTKETFIIKKGDRIAQLLITKSLVGSEIEIEEAEELSDSNRGAQGFGSSGR
ncbi:MAG: dUTP diphosphatase, partial [Phoenicibacter congonensis]|nr:dUTP diphosphatase [Phoenicibacter congonensis]